MISPKKVKYNNFSSNEFPTFTLLTDLAFDSDQGEVSSYLSREAIASESYHGEFKRVSGYKYTESLAPKLTFIKEGFADFTLEEVRKVLTWLTSKKTASFLDVYDDIQSNTIMYSILGGFTDIQTYKLGNNRTVAIVATFEAVNPWAWSALQTVTKDVSDPSNNTITIDINTDEPESAIYPRITIKQKDSVIVDVDHEMITNKKWVDNEDWIDGTVYRYINGDGTTWYYYQKHDTTTDDKGNTINIAEPTATQDNPTNNNTKTSVVIKNIYTDENGVTQVAKLKIANNMSNEIVVLDGANRIVSSWRIGTNLTTGEENVLLQNSRVFGDYFNWSWLPLYNGINTIEVIGNCEVKLEYREVRKIGEC